MNEELEVASRNGNRESRALLKQSLATRLRDEILQGRSARVLNLTESDIIHIYQIRGALKGLAARIIAERKPPLQDMEFAMSAIQVTVARNDALKVIDSVQRFHRLQGGML